MTQKLMLTMFGFILYLFFLSLKAAPADCIYWCVHECAHLSCVNIKKKRVVVVVVGGLFVCVWHLHNKDAKPHINCLIFLLVRNSLADSKGTRQEIGPVPLISRMTDLWSLPEMEGKGTFPAWLTAQHLWDRRVWEKEKDRVKENTFVSKIHQ